MPSRAVTCGGSTDWALSGSLGKQGVGNGTAFPIGNAGARCVPREAVVLGFSALSFLLNFSDVSRFLTCESVILEEIQMEGNKWDLGFSR